MGGRATVKQRFHMLTGLVMGGTAMHCLESILIFKLNDSGVVALPQWLLKPSPNETLEGGVFFVGRGKPLSKFGVFACFYGWERDYDYKHGITSKE